MTIYEIITKKKRNAELTADEINWVTAGYTSGSIPDHQMSALLMAICFSSLSERETSDLTMAMARSGDMLKPDTGGFNVDKHSTGGVGDKTTLICAPIAAACGVCVPKMSGRGLGHTGGTIDKLSAIPGFRTDLGYDEFIGNVRKAGLAISGQTGKLVPADKKIYALRDATATVDSIPLICSSIMSKKLASGADGIVLDVKVGDGAFMKTISEAEKLAEMMVRVGNKAGRKCTAILTDMSKPLGKTVGNALEVIEAIEALKGNAPKDLHEVSAAIAAEMLFIAGKGSREECISMSEKAIADGSALERLREMIILQGGDPKVIENYELLPQAKVKREIFAKKSGYICGISCEETGIISAKLGAGRLSKEAAVDLSAGIVFDKTVGDHVEKGERIAVLHTSSDCDIESIAEEFGKVFHYGEKNDIPEEKNVIKTVKGY